MRHGPRAEGEPSSAGAAVPLAARRALDVAESSPAACLVTDVNGIVAWANRAAGRLLRLGADLLAGKPLGVFVAEADRSRYAELLDTLRAGHSTRGDASFELETGRRSQTPVRAHVAAAGRRGEEPVALHWLLYDTTAAKRLEAASSKEARRLEHRCEVLTGRVATLEARLHDAAETRHFEEQRRCEAEALLDAVGDLSFDAVVSVGPDGVVRTWNRAAARMFGYPAREVVGRPLGSVIECDCECAQGCLQPGDGCRLTEVRDTAELTARRSDGSDFPAQVSCGSVQLGAEPRCVVVVRDVSQSQRLERALREARAEGSSSNAG